jgi:hypothetical protein
MRSPTRVSAALAIMTILDALTAIQNNGIARAITKSDHLVIAGLQILHVFAFLLLLSALVLMSLRLLGLALQRESIPQVTRGPTRLFWLGLSLAVISGALMFVTGTKHYYFNRAFDAKMLLLLIAVVIQLALFRRLAVSESPRPALARVTVALSLVFWFGIAIAGRAIGFV